MKKCLVVLLIAGLTFSFVACGKEEKKTTKEATTATSEATTQAEKKEETEAATEASTKAEETTAATTEANIEETTDASSEETTEATTAAASEGSFAIATTASDDQVKAFATSVQNAVVAYDWPNLGDLIAYPITVDGNNVNNKDELKALLDEHIISPKFLSAVGQPDVPDNLFANGQGICIADGEIWFRDVNFDGISQNSDPSFKIIAINGIIGE